MVYKCNILRMLSCNCLHALEACSHLGLALCELESSEDADGKNFGDLEDLSKLWLHFYIRSSSCLVIKTAPRLANALQTTISNATMGYHNQHSGS